MRMTFVNTTNMEKIATSFGMAEAESEAIGRRLGEARKAANMERKDVARRLGSGFSVSAIQAHENGRNDLRPSVALRYCKLYKVSLEWLLTGDGNPKASPPPETLDETLLGDAIFTVLAGVKELREPTDQDLQDLTDAAVRAYERLRDRQAKKMG